MFFSLKIFDQQLSKVVLENIFNLYFYIPIILYYFALRSVPIDINYTNQEKLPMSLINTALRIISTYKHIFAFICTLFIVLNVFSQVDSSYIGFFDRKTSIRPYFIEKFTALSHEVNGNGDEIEYRPNTPMGIGIGATYKNISLSGGYGFNFMRDKEKGKTKSIDFQYHHYARKFVIDFFFQNYKGFYTEDSDEEYTLYPDIKLIQYGTFAQYIFNGNKFSYQAAYNQNEKQLKSAGSFLLGGGIYYNKAASDSTLVFINSRRLNNFQFGVSGGYAYTWVPNKRIFVSGSISVGVNVGTEGIRRVGKEKFKIYPTAFPRFSMGYNHDTWSIGLSTVINRVYIVYSGDSKMSFDTGVIQLSFIKRFDVLPLLKK